MQGVLAVTKALADEQRVRALMFLCEGELCVCQIIELLGLAPSTVSKHMSILKQAGLVLSRKEGRWIYYRLPGTREASRAVIGAIRWLQQALDDDETIDRDAAQVGKVREIDKATLCCLYKRCGPAARQAAQGENQS